MSNLDHLNVQATWWETSLTRAMTIIEDVVFDTEEKLENYLDFLDKTQQNTFKLLGED